MAQNPIVTFEMEDGAIMRAEPYPEIAPISVNNFISLIQSDFYNGLTWHGWPWLLYQRRVQKQPCAK